MSIWGKIVGGIGGFALGGPLGALLGTTVGHMYDRYKQTGVQGRIEDSSQSVVFTIGVIALGAKMAKADGVVTRDEIDAFKRVFKVSPEDEKHVAHFFDQAKESSDGFEVYARQLAQAFSYEPKALEQLLWCLSCIAKADGRLHPAEQDFLLKVSDIFGLSRADFERIAELQLEPDMADPYVVLGVSKKASAEEIRKRHRQLVRENHPDRLIAQGVPEELISLSQEKLSRINAAYDRIRQGR